MPDTYFDLAVWFPAPPGRKVSRDSILVRYGYKKIRMRSRRSIVLVGMQSDRKAEARIKQQVIDASGTWSPPIGNLAGATTMQFVTTFCE